MTLYLLSRKINRLREWGSCMIRKFQSSGEIDAVEGIALAIGKVGVRVRGPPVRRL